MGQAVLHKLASASGQQIKDPSCFDYAGAR